MKAKDFTLKIVNEIEKGKFELKEFKPYMSYESFIGCILGDAEILRPTGIKDRTGKEIYEGDILEGGYLNPLTNKFVSRKYLIEYRDGGFSGNLIGSSPYGDTLLIFINGEVIGNIFENPELFSS